VFGRSVFYKDENGDIFRTHASYARGGDLMLGTYNILDLMPESQDETGPNHNLTDLGAAPRLLWHRRRYRCRRASPVRGQLARDRFVRARQ